MNKVLIPTLMMLSFISKDGRSREETTPTPTGAAKQIQQNTSKIQIKPQNQNKTTNRTKAKKGTDLLTRNKKIILFTAAFLAIIFGINHLKGEKSQQTSGQQVKTNDNNNEQSQQEILQKQQPNPFDENTSNINNTINISNINNSQSQQRYNTNPTLKNTNSGNNSSNNNNSSSSNSQQQLEQEEEQKRIQEEQEKWNSIKANFESKSCEQIFEYLGLHTNCIGNTNYVGREMSLNIIKKLNDTITEEVKNTTITELQRIIIEVLKGMECIKDYKNIDGDFELKKLMGYFIDKNMTEVTYNGDTKVTFYNPRNAIQSYHAYCYNGTEKINKEEFTNIKNLTNAIFKLIDILLKSDPNYAICRGIDYLTFEEMKRFDIFCYGILRQTPTGANTYIVELQKILRKNDTFIRSVFERMNSIENTIKNININILFKKSNKHPGYQHNSLEPNFILSYSQGDNNYDYKSCRDNNHQNCEICSEKPNSLCRILTLKVQEKEGEEEEKKEEQQRQIKEVLREACEKIIDLEGDDKMKVKLKEIISEIKTLLVQTPEQLSK